MKKILFTLAILSGLAVSSFAQSSNGENKFSIGVEAGVPVGDASNGYNFVIGGSLKYDAAIADNTAFTVSAGYSSFQGKTVTILGATGKIPAAGFVPLKAGLKYYFADSFYGEGQLGAAFSTQSGGGTAFVYAPGIGYKFCEAVDLGVRYEAWSHSGTVSQVAARLAYSF